MVGPHPDWAPGAPCVGLRLALVRCVRSLPGLLVWNTHLPLWMRRATPRPAAAYFSPLGVCALCAQRDAGFKLSVSLMQPSVSLLRSALVFPARKAGRVRCGPRPRAGADLASACVTTGPAGAGLRFSVTSPVRPGLALARRTLRRAAGSE